MTTLTDPQEILITTKHALSVSRRGGARVFDIDTLTLAARLSGRFYGNSVQPYSGTQVKVNGLRLGLPEVAGDPADAVNGDIWYNTSTSKLRGRQGAVNVDLGGGGGGNVATDTIWDALGDLVYGTGPDTGARLAGDTSNTRKFLRGLSVAGVAQAPVWDTLLDADIPAALMRDAEHTAIGDAAPHHAAVTLGGGSDAALTLVGQTLTLADVLTPAEHTALGDAAPHHAASHNIFSADHADTTGAASPVDGDVIIANATPKWSKLAISIPAANVRNVLGVDNGELRPSWKAALDTTVAADVAAAGGAGTSLIFSHRDHVHRGVLSINKAAAATLYGAVTLSEGANITLTQVGQDVAIAAAGGGGAHNIFSATHSDTTGAAAPVDGDIIIGNVTPAWSKLAISIPAANVRNVLGIDNTELRPSWKTALDATNPANIAVAASPGTSLVFAHRDHVHAHPDLGDLHTGYLLATGARAGSTSQAQSFGVTGIKADVIAESTAAAGVTVDGLLIKDDYIEIDEIAAPGAPAANKLRHYAVDVDAKTMMAYADSAGRVSTLYGAPSVRVTKSATQSILHATFTAVTWDGEDYDTDAMHSLVSNTSRLTAPVAGVYGMWVNLEYPNVAISRLITRFRLNGVTDILFTEGDNASAIFITHSLYGEYSLAAGEYVEVMAWQNQGSAQSINSNFVSKAGMTWLRAAP